jgi:hypothetical protein
MSYASDVAAYAGLEGISQETLDGIADYVRKSQTSGITTGTGIFGIDLTGLVSLVPVNTKFRNSVGREGSPDGAKQTQWRALLNVNNAQPSPLTGFDYAASLVVVDEQDVFAPYVPLGMAGRVTQDSIDLAKGYADALAIEQMSVLNQLMIGENKIGLGGQAYALPTIVTPTATSAATGGTILHATQYDIKVQARSGLNYYYGGSGIASSAVSPTTASTPTADTYTITATTAAVKGAVAYDWFIGTHSGTLYYYTTTFVATCTFTSIPTANLALPSLPDLSTVAPTAAATVDTSYSANSFNGLLAGILGDYGSTAIVTPSTGTPSGAYWSDAGAATFTYSGGAITQIDAMLLSIYQSVRLSPDTLIMNAQQAQDLTNKLFATSAAYTVLQPDESGKANTIAGGFVAHYINKASGGDIVDIFVEPDMPQGTIVARTDSVPFPGANIEATLKFRTLRDYSSFAYGASYNPGVAGGGPREDFEIRSVETLVNRAPVTFGVISNIANG